MLINKSHKYLYCLGLVLLCQPRPPQAGGGGGSSDQTLGEIRQADWSSRTTCDNTLSEE